MFNILDLANKSLVKNEDGTILVLETGALAAAKASALRLETGKKYSPCKAVEKTDDSWKERELKRFETGEYKRVVSLESRNLIVEDHFVHHSNKQSYNLAYTKNVAKALDDIQTTISITGYLETFFPKMKAKEIEEIKKEHMELFYKDAVAFATTPDEIERVYTKYSEDHDEVAESCMKHEAENFSAKIHPVRAYGAGDLAIAYIANNDGETIARALCWPEKMIYGRVYDNTDHLHSYLKELGFKQSSYYGSNLTFEGARLLKLEYKDRENSLYFVLPYVDEDISVEDKGDYLVFTTSEGCADTSEPCGISRYYMRKICPKCSSNAREDQFMCVITAADQISELDLRPEWCATCMNDRNKVFYCDGLGLYLDKDSFTSYNVYLEQHRYPYAYSGTYSDAYIKDYSKGAMRFCKRDPKVAYKKEFAKQVIVDSLGTIEEWSPESVDKYAWKCRLIGKTYSNDIAKPDLVKVLVDIKKRRIYKKWSTKEAELNSSPYYCEDGKLVQACNALIYRLQLRKAA